MTATDPNGTTVRSVHDQFGRPTETYVKDDGAGAPEILLERVTYNLTGETDITNPASPQNVTTVSYIDPDQTASVRSVTYFDGPGRTYLTETDGEEGKKVHQKTVFNKAGQVDEESFPYFPPFDATVKFSRYRYDALGRLTQAENPDGTYSRLFHEDWQSTSEFHAVGGGLEQKGKAFFDAFGRVLLAEEFADAAAAAPSGRMDYLYDRLGNLLRVRDEVAIAAGSIANVPGEKRHVTTVSYDSLSRKTSIDDPDMGKWSYGYDKAGNLLVQVDARGKMIGFSYDDLNRPVLKDYPSPETDIVYQYDTAPVGCPSSGSTNLTGRLTRVSDQTGCETYSYDFLGRATKSTRVTTTYRFVNEYTYDLLDRIVRRSFPDEVYDFNYDGPFLQEIRSVGKGQSYVRNVDYDPAGQITAVSLGTVDTAAPVLDLAYEYDPETLFLSRLRA
ncbi:MAG: hypothetical protein ACREDF_01045, partial [Thermoplasmata archaeon]